MVLEPWRRARDVHVELNTAPHLWNLNSLQLLIDTQVSQRLESWAWFIDTFMIGGEQTSDHCLKCVSLFSPLFTYKHNKTLNYQWSYSFDLQATLVWSPSWHLRAISLCVCCRAEASGGPCIWKQYVIATCPCRGLRQQLVEGNPILPAPLVGAKKEAV